MSSSKNRDKVETTNDRTLDRRSVLLAGTTLAAAAIGSGASIELAQSPAQAQPAPSGQRPNIVVIMGDDIGIWNIGAYHRGMMAGRTPNLDKLADGGQTPFAQSKGTVLEGGYRAPPMVRWPGRVPAGKVENGIISGLDWLPTLVAAAGNPNIAEELKKGKQMGDRTHKVHLDGYNQLDMITGKGPSNRHELWYFGASALGAVRIDDYKYRFIDQPMGWLGEKTKPDVPYITNLRLDPFERTGRPNNGTKDGAQQYFDWFKYEFWRFVFVQQQVEKLAQTAIEFPPMQKGASFNLEAVKANIEAARHAMAK
jgi:arylsulfatase A-like enzyme